MELRCGLELWQWQKFLGGSPDRVHATGGIDRRRGGVPTRRNVWIGEEVSIELLISALVGAIVALPGSWWLARWQVRAQAAERVRETQFNLVRDIASYRRGPGLAQALNQVPVVFGNDVVAMEKFRACQSCGQVDMDAVISLLGYLASRVGLPASISESDLASGFDA